MSNQAEAMMQDQIEGAISENEALRQEVERLSTQVRQADERGDLAMRRAHAALAALERIEKTPGEECFVYRGIALGALAADERMVDGA